MCSALICPWALSMGRHSSRSGGLWLSQAAQAGTEPQVLQLEGLLTSCFCGESKGSRIRSVFAQFLLGAGRQVSLSPSVLVQLLQYNALPSPSCCRAPSALQAPPEPVLASHFTPNSRKNMKVRLGGELAACQECAAWLCLPRPRAAAGAPARLGQRVPGQARNSRKPGKH